jgi:hypothetical protein
MLFLNLKTTQQMKLLKAFKVVRDNQKRKLKFIIGIMSSFFIISFYFSFNYCSVLYNSKKTFILTFFIGILLDLVVYEGLINLLLSFVYCCKGVHLGKTFKTLFLFRSYRNCM